MNDNVADYESLIDGLNVNKKSWIPWYWKIMQLVRWFVTNVLMIFLKDSCVAQIFLLLAISVFF